MTAPNIFCPPTGTFFIPQVSLVNGEDIATFAGYNFGMRDSPLTVTSLGEANEGEANEGKANEGEANEGEANEGETTDEQDDEEDDGEDDDGEEDDGEEDGTCSQAGCKCSK
jgi:hypothetical protein